jgi:hypothetical protein
MLIVGDVFIIDFEGRRTLAERRKAPAARPRRPDRSIDYSATAALDRALRSAPMSTQGHQRSTIGASGVVVLGAYHERLTDPRLWPQDRDKASNLLDFSSSRRCFMRSNTSCLSPPLGASPREGSIADPAPGGSPYHTAAEAYAVIGASPDPFHYLAYVEGNPPVVQAFVPDAEEVGSTRRKRKRVARVHDAGLLPGGSR